MITYPNLGNHGRIGNQLWQIASTLGIAHRLGEDAGFPEWVYEKFFRIPSHYFGKSGLFTPATEYVTHLPPEALPYLQDFNLWSDIQAEIHEWFQPSKLAMETLAQYTDFWNLEPPILSVHVRRGDNVLPPIRGFHPLRPLSYYREAISELKGEFESIAVFSDDPEWCRAHIKADYYHVGTPRPKEHEAAYKTAPILDWIDLQMQAFCDRHVCSNSSYAWWGAFLSQDPHPIIPDPFFGPRLQMIDSSLLLVPGWRTLNHANGTE